MPPRAAPGPGRAQPSRGRGRGRGTPSDVASVATTSSAGGASRGRGRGTASDVASVQSTSSTPRGRGRGAGAAGATRGGAVAIAGHIRTVGVKRPGFGTGGRIIQVIVNAFQTTITDNIIYQYDVDFSKSMSPRENNVLIQALQDNNKELFRNGRLAFDGRKIAFCTNKLQLGPTDERQFPVSFPIQGPQTGNRPPKVYTIKLAKTLEINTEVLHRFIASQQTQDNDISTSLSALNVAIRMQPNLIYPFNVRSFFTPTGKKDIRGGLELWQGYFQSLRPSQNMMYVNVDISTGVMYKAMPLIGLCLEFLGKNNPGDLANLRDRDRLSLQRFIVNVRVETTYGGRKRVHVIKKVSRDSASAYMFDLNGVSTSVQRYFQNLNVQLRHPSAPCIDMSRGAIPIELCNVIPGQIMRKQFPEDKTNEMVEFARKVPAERLAAIMAGLDILKYEKSPYVQQFGMDISKSPMTLTARVLNPPTLRYGGGGTQATIRPANGQWNMRDKILFKPEVIKNWAVVIFETQRFFNDDTANAMVRGFIDGAQSVGITVANTRPVIRYANAHQGISKQLNDAGTAAFHATKTPPTLIVVVLPEGGNQIYTAVKHFGDVERGVPTQCLKARKCSRANPQYWANVMLKVNAKLGGVNAVLENSPLNDKNHPTIVMGADAMHPPPGTEGRPSYTSLVSSVDQFTAKYVAISKLQQGRQEIIADLEDMVKYALSKYALWKRSVEKSDKPPTRLIFYRDGVSEGQFQQVLDNELVAIQNACKAMKINPKITLIIVGKRHHIRMFPHNPKDADRSGNCPAGTTIDNGLGHPTEFDYYQLTHGGLIGTSRPAHYSVIYDESNFNADAMQNLSFALTHVYARATRSVSIPAPVYYADIVCSRSRNHYPPDANPESTEVGSQVSQATDQLERFQQAYRPLHGGVALNMYFM